ncbi:hypothetical protein LCGC14_3067570 [marine sediment metagenome]|uniref:Uncharacterized protein n=1 Tax=marine sediment metagenome TaxID=412755 RepID=A0A0F8X5B8_9ZZZZ
MTTMTTDRTTFNGTVQACCHRISFYYDLGEVTLTEKLKERLREEAEGRAREMIAEDYWSGELCCHPNCDDNDEFFGWWNIETD